VTSFEKTPTFSRSRAAPARALEHYPRTCPLLEFTPSSTSLWYATSSSPRVVKILDHSSILHPRAQHSRTHLPPSQAVRRVVRWSHTHRTTVAHSVRDHRPPSHDHRCPSHNHRALVVHPSYTRRTPIVRSTSDHRTTGRASIVRLSAFIAGRNIGAMTFTQPDVLPTILARGLYTSGVPISF
jgi:hypothetical protein